MGGLRLGDVAFTAPPQWQSQLSVVGPVEAGFRPNVVVTTQDVSETETPVSFAIRVLPELERTTTGYQKLEEGLATFGEISGFLRNHSFFADGVKIGQLQFYLVSHGVARTFTLSHLAQRIDSLRPVAEALFATIKVFERQDTLRPAGQFRG